MLSASPAQPYAESAALEHEIAVAVVRFLSDTGKLNPAARSYEITPRLETVIIECLRRHFGDLETFFGFWGKKVHDQHANGQPFESCPNVVCESTVKSVREFRGMYPAAASSVPDDLPNL